MSYDFPGDEKEVRERIAERDAAAPKPAPDGITDEMMEQARREFVATITPTTTPQPCQTCGGRGAGPGPHCADCRDTGTNLAPQPGEVEEAVKAVRRGFLLFERDHNTPEGKAQRGIFTLLSALADLQAQVEYLEEENDRLEDKIADWHEFNHDFIGMVSNLTGVDMRDEEYSAEDCREFIMEWHQAQVAARDAEIAKLRRVAGAAGRVQHTHGPHCYMVDGVMRCCCGIAGLRRAIKEAGYE